MMKHLLLHLAFAFFTACLCEAQPDVAATKKGALSTSASSGSAASGTSIYDYANINTSELNLLDPTTAIFCLNNSTMILGVKLTWSNADWPQGRGYWYYSDHINDTLQSFSLNGSGYIYDSVIVNKPGVYHYKCNAGTVGILITSSIALDSIPNQTTFCPNGSINLSAPEGSFSDYQWYNGSSLLMGANSNSYIATETGNYYVRTTDANNGCILNSDIINVTVYSPPSQLNITSADHNNLTLDGSKSDLNPKTVTWYRNGDPIKSFSDTGVVVAGGHGAGSELNQLNQPYGIFIDTMKNIYIADGNNSRIMKWNSGTEVGQQIIKDQLYGDTPKDVVLDSPFLYISGGQNVYQYYVPFDITYTVYNEIPPNGGFDSWGLSINLNHNLYFGGSVYGEDMSDPSNFQYFYNPGIIYKFYGAAYEAVAGARLDDPLNIQYPNGFYVDSLDNLYVSDNVTDSLNHNYGRIVKWRAGTEPGQLMAGGNASGNAPNQIGFAAGVTFDKHGNLYVADVLNNRVQLWKPGANFGITIASGFTPWGIKVDDSDNVYVADQTNNQVLRFPSLLFNTIKADSPGVYKAVVTYPGGCTVTSNDFIVKGALPVALLNFKGQLKNRDAILHWQTSAEYNTSYFNIQRSTNGVNFQKIGKIQAAGNSSILQNYTYTDHDLAGLGLTMVYYRLEEKDVDDQSSLSKVISLDATSPGWFFTVNPNPVSNMLRIRLTNLYGKTSISIMDISGRKIMGQQINGSGNNELNFKTDNLSRGLYIIEVNNDEKSELMKFMKE